ncbi:hypothetical protein PoB_004518700 [Plakobranchus ocellatus]|uniref:Uncharacterized protein n=1 Tax=Plakobranchus ocellatus TaxID=259542 RepID=A0AAV4BH25_9GAST|nr:hypothetical protein PoB_004518700 [Plakobranchus ocellatus]
MSFTRLKNDETLFLDYFMPLNGNKREETRPSLIATSIPEMCQLRLDLLEKENKSKCTRKSKKQLFVDQETSDSDLDLSMDDILDSDSETESVSNSQPEEDILELGVVDNPKIEDFVLCEYAMKTKVVYYIGIVKKERDEDDELELEFFKRMHRNENKFVSTVEDICTVHIDQLKAILPPPV